MKTNIRNISDKMKMITMIAFLSVITLNGISQNSTKFSARNELKDLGLSMVEFIVPGDYRTAPAKIEMMTIAEYEENLPVESWMTNPEDLKADAADMNYVIRELKMETTVEGNLLIENWMTEPGTVTRESVKLELERKLSPACEGNLPLESWMLNPATFVVN